MNSFKKVELKEAIAKMEDLQDSSRQSYFRIIGTMLRKTENIDIRNGLIPMIEYLEQRFLNKDIARNSGRLYKSALLYAIADDASRRIDNNESIDLSISMYDRVQKLRTNKLDNKSSKTSGLRKKHFPPEVIEQLIELAISNKRFKKLRECIAFIKANNVLGLRPVEWLNINFFNYLDRGYIADTIDNKEYSTLAVTVANAKHSHGRSFGINRDIILAGIDHEKLSWITNFNNLMTREIDGKIGTAREDAGKEYLKSLQKALYDALNKLQIPVDQRPSIYSTRHQCISNAKKRGLTPLQIAALFGHASTETARMHYGKKQHGRTSITVIPSKESIEAIEKLINDRKNGISIEPGYKALTTAQILLNK